MKHKILPIEMIRDNLPASSPGLDPLPELGQLLQQKVDVIVVLDDDPTGTQTVYDVPVLTEWTTEAIQNEIARNTPLFFVLTNSRSIPKNDAEVLAFQIGQSIQQAAAQAEKRCMVISRSDSTLRGHYPGEVDALELGMGLTESIQILIPAFFEGGRYTFSDIHYVKEDEKLVPVAQSSYAQDHYFGFENSNLKAWVAEKTRGGVPDYLVISVSLEELRMGYTEQLIQKLNRCKPGSVIIVNAICYQDLQQFALALLQSNISFVCRTAASFVATLFNQTSRPLLNAESLGLMQSQAGALIVVGSYVPTTTQQLRHLFAHYPSETIELDLRVILHSTDLESEINHISARIDQLIQQGQDLVLYTGREFIASPDQEENLKLGSRISEILTQIVGRIRVQPRYILSKGGVTSSNTATLSLGMRRATVAGQILPGVPVWLCGQESAFPGLPLIIFPGNVGQQNSLTQVLYQLSNQGS